MKYLSESLFDMQANGRRPDHPVRKRRRWCMPMLLAGLMMATTPALAADDEPGLLENMGDKLVRGLINVSTGWTEIPLQIHSVWEREGWITGVLRGPIDGIGMFFARTVAGMVEIVTCPVPLPTYRPILEPAFAWSPIPPDDIKTAAQQ